MEIKDKISIFINPPTKMKFMLPEEIFALKQGDTVLIKHLAFREDAIYNALCEVYASSTTVLNNDTFFVRWISGNRVQDNRAYPKALLEKDFYMKCIYNPHSREIGIYRYDGDRICVITDAELSRK